MTRALITLKKLAEELIFLKNCKIIECFTQEKNIIIINIYDGSNQIFLEINLNNGLESVFYHKNFSRARINSVDLFKEITGEYLIDISIYKNDRILQFHFNNFIFNVVLFGFSKNNIILTDKYLKIIKQYKNKGLFEFNDKISESSIEIIEDYISKINVLFNKELIKEFLFINNLVPKSKISNLAEYFLNQINDKAVKFLSEICNHKKSYILKNDKNELKFSIYPLAYFGEIYLEFNNINEGIRRFKSEKISDKNFETLFNSYNQKLEKVNKKLNNQLKNIEILKNSEYLINDYKLFGEILLAYPNQKVKELNQLVALDWDNNERTIKLNKNKTINENAQNYFQKSKNLKDEIEIKSSWTNSISSKKIIIEKLQFELKKIENIKELKKFETRMKEIEIESNKAIENAESDKFRIFDLGNGFMLYVGKSAANNDELTMKFAKPNDLWMHARGSAGSHAVIRLKKEENPPKDIIKKAASVVAYYSQARNAKYVPVCYTFKKYVRKPKGANPGSVVIQKETVVMVEPKLPE